jgi:hypothetical protein
MPQFRKGQSGNPAGRPPGSRNRATSMVQNLLEGAAENIAKRAAQLAEEGNVAAIRICMNRLSPVGQHNPVAFELPPIHSPQDCLRATSAILTGIASGDIAPAAALQIARLIDVHLRAISTNDLEAHDEAGEGPRQFGGPGCCRRRNLPMTDFARQRLRVERLEKPLRRERRTHLIWWDEEEESESDVRLRVSA